jgi:dTMP kinase
VADPDEATAAERGREERRAGGGLFLTFEGPDGAGKTTQIVHLAGALVARGHAVTCTREPGGDAVGERVRELLLHAKLGALGSEAELLLFEAARAQNVQTVVRPALARGHIVLCDRFADSTIAYQGWGRGLPLALIAAVNAFATGGLVPDRTFLLDLPSAAGLARQREGDRNRLDREQLAFHERVRAGFLDIAAREPNRVQVLDATRPEAEIAARLLAAVIGLLAR